MSAWGMNWSLVVDVPSSAHRLVLMGLAQFAVDGWESCVAVDVPASIAVLPPQEIELLVDDLVGLGLVQRYETAAVLGVVRVRLLIPESVARMHPLTGVPPVSSPDAQSTLPSGGA